MKTAMGLHHVKLMMRVTMKLMCLCLLTKILHMELYNRTWLPWSQDQSAINQSKELNPTFLHWTRHLPDIRTKKQMPNGLVTQSN